MRRLVDRAPAHPARAGLWGNASLCHRRLTREAFQVGNRTGETSREKRGGTTSGGRMGATDASLVYVSWHIPESRPPLRRIDPAAESWFFPLPPSPDHLPADVVFQRLTITCAGKCLVVSSTPAHMCSPARARRVPSAVPLLSPLRLLPRRPVCGRGARKGQDQEGTRGR